MTDTVNAGQLGALELPIAAEQISLEEGALRQLAGWRPAHGVLSVYVDADPGAQARSTPPWRTQITQELNAIEKRLHEDGPRDRWQAFQGLRTTHAAALDAVMEQANPGRGRVLMLSLDGKTARGLAIQDALTSGAYLDEGPRLLPLIRALGHGGLIGIVAAARDEVHVVETRLGRVGEVETKGFDRGSGDPGQHRGPAPANPARAQQAVNITERYERHVDELRSSFLGEVAKDVASRCSRDAWSGVLVAAGPGLAEELAGALERHVPEVRAVHHDIEGYPDHELVKRLAPEVADFARERLERELAAAVEAAAASGHGARGMADVLSSLNEGRVAHLFVPAGNDVPGSRLPDGELSDEPDATDANPLDSLFEAMAARALETSARVSVVDVEQSSEPVASTRW